MEDILIPLHEIAMTKIEMAKWYVIMAVTKTDIPTTHIPVCAK